MGVKQAASVSSTAAPSVRLGLGLVQSHRLLEVRVRLSTAAPSVRLGLGLVQFLVGARVLFDGFTCGTKFTS